MGACGLAAADTLTKASKFHSALTLNTFTRAMRKTLLLVLPVLFPSWRFFKSIEPSPRVEWTTVSAVNSPGALWHAFRPRPERLGILPLLLSVFWNPKRNQDLFFVSCAERIQETPDEHSVAVIKRGIQFDTDQTRLESPSEQLIFRLVFVRRKGTKLVRDVVFQSDAFPAQASVAQ